MDPSPRDRDRAAFDRTARERAAVDLSGAPAYRLDAVYASAQALATARRLAPYRSAIAELRGFDIAHLDRLEDYATALLFAHSVLLAHAGRVRRLPALASEGWALRAVLLAYAELLARKGRVSAGAVARLREGSGYRALVVHLAGLAQLFREVGDAVGPGAPVTAAEVDRAGELAHEIVLEIGADSDPDLAHDTLVLERNKLAVLLLRAQAQLRRAMEYLRFDEGDAATLVPTFYLTRPRGRRGEEAKAEPAPAPPGTTAEPAP